MIYMIYKNNCDVVNVIDWDCVVVDECYQLKDRWFEMIRVMGCVNVMCWIGFIGMVI